MKRIGIDYGTKRVGVAVSDDSGVVAFPRMTLLNDRTLMGELVAFIEKENPGEIVLGESVGPTGDNPVMKDIRFFADELTRLTGVPVAFASEFGTSAEARQNAEANGAAKSFVDAEAAALILNSYLAHYGNHA